MRRIFNSPLARWLTPALGALALTTGQLVPALVCAAVTAYAWSIHR